MSDFRQPARPAPGTIVVVHEDVERCWRAVQAKGTRFDGWFVTAVKTTRVYCRPSCPVRPPRRSNVSFHPTAAAAQTAGFRAGKLCLDDVRDLPSAIARVRRLLDLDADPEAAADRWRPWRSYAVQHLCASLDHPINDWSPT